MPVITVPRILREKLSEEGADALVVLLNQTEEKVKDAIVRFSEEKYERRLVEVSSELRALIEEKNAEVKEEIAGLRVEIAGVKSSLKVEIAEVKSSLEEKIANVKADIIKWMFIFWVGQVGVLIGILFLFFK